MPQFKMPFSGDVNQSINPWTFLFNPYGSQFGLININLGKSSNPSVEEEVLNDVGSYGKQLGRLGDAMLVLLEHFKPERKLNAREAKAIEAFQDMLSDITQIKKKYS
jgi:hypothetical protein